MENQWKQELILEKISKIDKHLAGLTQKKKEDLDN